MTCTASLQIVRKRSSPTLCFYCTIEVVALLLSLNAGQVSADFMELRKHPRMSYRGRPNWPPRWVWLGGKQNERPTGEVGVLKQVSRYSLLTSDGLSLVMEHNDSAYMGLLLFDDFVFSRRVHELLKTLRDHPISAIGGVEINDMP